MPALLLILALYHGANGLAMLVAPHTWYAAVPGAAETGPFNGHFVSDIAVAFLAAALGLALASRPSGRAALWPATAFLGGHVLLHLPDLAASARPALTALMLIVVPGLLPALLGIYATARRKPQ